MKITKSHLRSIIKEELQKMDEIGPASRQSSRTSFKRDGKSINEEEEGIVFHLPGTKEDLNLLLSIIKSTGGPSAWGGEEGRIEHVEKLVKRIKDLLSAKGMLDRGNMSYEEQRADD